MNERKRSWKLWSVLLAALLVYALLGTSRHLVVQATSATAALLASAVGAALASYQVGTLPFNQLYQNQIAVYNAEMPAQDYLTDEQVADVLNYVMNSWGNKGPIISPDVVKIERDRMASDNKN